MESIEQQQQLALAERIANREAHAKVGSLSITRAAPMSFKTPRTHVLRCVPARRVERVRDPVRVRAIRPTDALELERFYAALSPESRRTRFFSVGSRLSHGQSLSFCTTDHDHREGFVAVVDGSPVGQERIVGHLCLEPDGEHAAGKSVV